MSLCDQQTEVESRMSRGDSFTDVEDWVNALDIDPLEAAGLWLLAFAYMPALQQRRHVKAYLAALTTFPAFIEPVP